MSIFTKKPESFLIKQLVINVLMLDSGFYWASDESKSLFIKETANIAKQIDIGKLPVWVETSELMYGVYSHKGNILRSKFRRWLFKLALNS